MALRTSLLLSILLGLSSLLLAAASGAGNVDLDRSSRFWVSPIGVKQWEPETVRRPESQSSPSMLMFEVTRFPNRGSTGPETQRARRFVQETFRAARANGWQDIDKAKADGFASFAGDPTHFVKNEYLRDEAVVDPNRPEYLMYYPHPDNADQMILVGVMYLVRKRLDHGPQVGGPMTRWHYHVWSDEVSYCVDEFSAIVAQKDSAGKCSVGSTVRYSPEMLHVWFVKHPRGPFSAMMVLPLETLGESSYEEMAGRILGEGGELARPLERAKSTGKSQVMEHHHH